MAFLTDQEMLDAAKSIARGVPVKILIDKHQKALENSPDVDVSDISPQKLRDTLSNEINSANPKSPRFKQKYEIAHQDAREAMQLEYAESAARIRNEIIEELEDDIKNLKDAEAACLKAAGGSFDAIEPAETLQEQVALIDAASRYLKLRYDLRTAQMRVIDAVRYNPDAKLSDAMKK